jgi:hypothetical protein
MSDVGDFIYWMLNEAGKADCIGLSVIGLLAIIAGWRAAGRRDGD